MTLTDGMSRCGGASGTISFPGKLSLDLAIGGRCITADAIACVHGVFLCSSILVYEGLLELQNSSENHSFEGDETSQDNCSMGSG